MSSPSGTATWLFRLSAALWLVWGLVHILAGFMTMSQIADGDTVHAVHGIVAAVDIRTVTIDYPQPVSALLSQHGFNLLWFGVVTAASAPFVWRGQGRAVFLASLVGGLADLGYFMFIDLGGYTLPPGPQMTWICAAAIAAGVTASRSGRWKKSRPAV